MNTPKKFKRYPTIEEVVSNFLGEPVTDISDYTVGSHTGEEVTGENFLQSIKKQGVWGFIDTDTVVHYWMDDCVSFGTFVSFIAHETGHLNGRIYKDQGKDEEKAHLFEQVALYAFKQASKMNPDTKVHRQIIKLIGDDAFAITFQSMGQYRSALIKNIAGMKK